MRACPRTSAYGINLPPHYAVRTPVFPSHIPSAPLHACSVSGTLSCDSCAASSVHVSRCTIRTHSVRLLPHAAGAATIVCVAPPHTTGGRGWVGCSVCSCVPSLAWTAGGHPNQMLVFIPPGFSHDMESLTNEEVVLEVFKVRAMPVCPCGTACTHGCIGAAAGMGTIASPSWTIHHRCHLAWRPPQDLSLLLRRTTAFLQQT